MARGATTSTARKAEPPSMMVLRYGIFVSLPRPADPVAWRRTTASGEAARASLSSTFRTKPHRAASPSTSSGLSLWGGMNDDGSGLRPRLITLAVGAAALAAWLALLWFMFGSVL